MGGFALTKPGLIDMTATTDPSTGQEMYVPQAPTFFSNLAARQRAALAGENSALDDSLSNFGDIHNVPSAVPNAALPKTFDPSFTQVTHDQSTRLPTQINPAETKLGKLIHIITAAASGAASAIGTQNPQQGMEAARTQQMLPLQRIMAGAQLQQQLAQTELTRQQTQMVQTPYGLMTTGMAKVIFPALIRGQAQRDVAGTNATSRQNVAQTNATSRQNVAEINKRYMAVPGVGLLDTQDPSGKPTLVPGSEQGIQLTQQHLDDYGLPPEFLGKFMTLQQLSQLERAQNQQTVLAQGANGPSLVNKKSGTTTDLGLGNPGMGKPMEVADPNNPGQTLITTGGQAQGAAGKGSASVAVAKKAAEGEVPHNIGDQRLAFSTALAHADLLTSAIRALDNGDEQTLNGLRNKFKQEFGASGPITAGVIADAYSREVQKGLSGGHITEGDTNKIQNTLNVSKQSMGQALDAVAAYKALFTSKMNNLDKQKQNAINSALPNRNRTNVQTPLATGVTHVFVPGQGLQSAQGGR